MSGLYHARLHVELIQLNVIFLYGMLMGRTTVLKRVYELGKGNMIVGRGKQTSSCQLHLQEGQGVKGEKRQKKNEVPLPTPCGESCHHHH